ncbi:hypothetical protein KM915_20930 [Cytobacillus oceanisediminis]|uniref:hypothetical protein n=1 Tax=Cytobacillus oceanisediminis TaxID=665099 RepID=UPI001C223877|nr:hypothetical protein [Cytobacillus oceanisediminis]MBU8732516.1 hypothetical protein [Cytobacillus oceanisediminis]
MFTSIQNLLKGIFGDFQTTFIWLFVIGILISGLLVWLGGEENAPKFKKSLVICIVGLMVFLLASPIVSYVDSYL